MALPPRRIAITGARGLIGSGLAPHLAGRGDEPIALARGGPGPHWDPTKPKIVAPRLDAIVHLAGAPISVRWGPGAKARIMQSRRDGTRNLCLAAAGLDEPPNVIVSASGVGWHGDTGDALAGEGAPPGDGFLPEVVQAWEDATRPAKDAGIRVVQTRFGIVLHPDGGALAKLRTPARLGLGGPIGNGRQWFPWVAYEDVLRAIAFVLDRAVEGPVHVVAPGIVRQREFAKALGHALHRPASMPLPAAMVRLLFGQMGEEVLLQGQRLAPERLRRAGFRFQYDTLGAALDHLLSERSA